MKDKIIKSFEEYLKNSSLWKFYKSLKIILNINKIKRLLASSYIPTPEFLKNKKAIINPQNEDQKCLLWCIVIHHNKHFLKKIILQLIYMDIMKKKGLGIKIMKFFL